MILYKEVYTSTYRISISSQ